MKEDFSDIAAYRNNWLLQIIDWFTIYPVLLYYKHTTTRSLKIAYLGDKQTIVRDIRHGATFLTNHRDIVMDAAWLSMLVRTRYNIRPYLGMGDNLFGKWWIEGLARFEHVYVVRRGVGAHALIEKSKHLSRYLMMLREQKHSIWLAEREGRSKDGNDRAQGSVLKMLTMAYVEEGSTDQSKRTQFFDAIRRMNICPVSINYEYDPCDYLKAQEFQLKRDNPRWRKRAKDDLLSMKTGIQGQKGNVIFRLTPGINPEIDELIAKQPEILDAPLNDQAQAVCDIIDRHIWAGYEPNTHFDISGTRENPVLTPTPEFESYVASRVALVDIPNRDEQYLHDRIVEMYANPVLNQLSVNGNGKL